MTRLAWGSATDVGRVRQENEDAVFTSERLFVVADGMGGHRGGQVASGLATKTLERDFGQDVRSRSTDALVRAVQRANEVVVSAATDDPELTGMGTTLCAMALVDGDGDERLAIVNVGDSRAYLLKSGDLEQITDDHSLVATLERQGRLTRDEAAVHPQRNILTRALGIDARVMVDSWEVRPVPGDRYVLCSDGLFNEVDESRIAATLRRLADPTEAARELVRLANEGGGRDNISLVVVDVVADESDPPVGTEAEGAADPASGDRVIAAVSGEARATGHVPGAQPVKPAVSPRERRKRERAAQRAVARANRPPHFTWRVLLFIVVLIAIVGATVAAITYYARDTYFVGFDHDQVVIYRGHPGGVLWIKPELVERSGLTRRTIPAASVPEIEAGKVEPTRDDAHKYLTNLADQATEQGTGSATTSTTTPGR
ncbi:MAG TPA: Stp1/IreP family PP2C-type Ser/Thr phosphatase [Acidimicrobiales bacterium]|nr:Stp1/IreP family PP2C-type Ser/Thr phosphatase [Acidimicrobiales bacterium]